jgi:transitional endoplasmic reticulum ATPase
MNQSAKSFVGALRDTPQQYIANECLTAGAFSPQSDLFSVGVVMYQMLWAMLPWNVGNPPFGTTNVETWRVASLLEQREKPLKIPEIHGIVDFDNSILNVLKKALQINTDRRFRTAKEFLEALNAPVGTDRHAYPDESLDSREIAGQARNDGQAQSSDKKLRGFAAIAGMQNLKNMLQTDVIDVIRNPEEYQAHGLGLPNGMLLYGPPGCGKTFFAERFAEEAGYNFRKIIASDIASIYVHGTQEKIGKLFDQARQNAPSILYFDEFDAMVPERENAQHSYGSEVNEFLSQLDNCGQTGVFVIGSTNKPQLLDKAILRAGRLEKHFYVPPPDFEARKIMFELYLKDRPLDFGIDYEELAKLTENYVSGDIKLIVDETSRKVIREKTKRITMDNLKFVIQNQKPTISIEILKQFEKIKDEMEGKKEKERRKIGF